MSKNKLNTSIIWTYGLGELSYILLMQTIVAQTNYFFTDILQISVGIVGTIMVISRIIEVISNPAVGIIIEKVNLPWGKYRSWLFIGVIPFSVFYALVFASGLFKLSQVLTLVLASVFMIIASVAGNFLYTADSSMLASLTNDTQERMLLSRSNGLGQQIGRVLNGLIMMPLILYFSTHFQSEEKGYAITIAFLAILTIIGYFALGISTKGHDVYKYDEEDVSVMDMFNQLYTNKPLILAVVIYFLKVIAFFLIYGMAIYYFKYVILDTSKLTITFTTFNLVAIPAVFLIPYLSKNIGVKKSYLVCMVAMLVSILAVKFINGNFVWFIILTCIYFACSSAINVLHYTILAAAIDYGEYMTGQTIRGLAMSLLPLSLDASRVIQQIVIAIGLGAMGYVANIESSPQIISGLTNMMSIVPALFISIGTVLLFFFKLDDKKIEEIRTELNSRKNI